MKIIGTNHEIELLLSALPGAHKGSSSIPSDGFVATYRGVSIDIEIVPDSRPSPCDLCMYNPPSSIDGKPCCMCPACAVHT